MVSQRVAAGLAASLTHKSLLPNHLSNYRVSSLSRAFAEEISSCRPCGRLIETAAVELIVFIYLSVSQLATVTRHHLGYAERQRKV